MLRASRGAARRAVYRRTHIVWVPTVFGPLKDIPQHVMQAKFIGFERTHRRRVDVAIVACVDPPSGIPPGRTLVGHVGTYTSAGTIRIPWPYGLSAAARGVFPFRGARQPVPMTGGCRQPS